MSETTDRGNEREARLRQLLREVLDAQTPPTPDPARARFARIHAPSERALRAEIMFGDLAAPLRRAAVLVLAVLVLALLSIGPAVAHDLGVTGSGGVITGAVANSLGSPLANANIRVLPVSDTRLWWALRTLTARSDADGTFRIEGVPAGLVNVRATAAGHVAQTVAEVEIRERGQTEVAFALATASVGEVTGVVADETGAPVAGATVRLAPSVGRTDRSPFEPSGFDIAARTDAAGAFRFGRVPEGDYALSAAAPGSEPDMRVGVRVAQGEVTRVDLVLRRLRQATVSGRVIEAGTGAPIAGAQVFFFAQTGARGGSATTSADGTFELTVDVGEFFLGAASAGHEGEISGPHTVGAGQTARIELVLARRDGAQPLADPRVRIAGGSPAPAPTARPSATAFPRFDPRTFGSGSWGSGGSWGGWRPGSTPSASPRR